MFSPQLGSTGIQDIYVIDTQTGRVWRRIFFSNIKGFYLSPLPYISADQLAVTATPPEFIMSESVSLQKMYDQEVHAAQQKEPDKK